MSNPQPAPQLIATTSGADGFETCYVSFATVIASDGALTGTPTVSVPSEYSDYVATSGAAISFAGVINGTTYTAGEILTFVATNQKLSKKTVYVDVIYQTPKRKNTQRFKIEVSPWEVTQT